MENNENQEQNENNEQVVDHSEWEAKVKELNIKGYITEVYSPTTIVQTPAEYGTTEAVPSTDVYSQQLPPPDGEDDGVWFGAQAARRIMDSAATATIPWRIRLSRAIINGFPLAE